MRINIMGHAGLLVENEQTRVLIDPLFQDSFVQGRMSFCPRRQLDTSALPEPSHIILSHHHWDHFDEATLQQLPREKPVYIPDDEQMQKVLKRLGFDLITVCKPWQPIRIGSMELIATPSEVEWCEMGMILRDADGTFWNMVDSEVSPALVSEFHALSCAPDVIAVKFQPQAELLLQMIQGRGVRLDKQAVSQWLNTVIELSPQLAFPYACGLAFEQQSSWLNTKIFPFSAPEIADLLAEALGSRRSQVVFPGDVIEVHQGKVQVREQAAGFVSLREDRQTLSQVWQKTAWHPLYQQAAPTLSPQQCSALEVQLTEIMSGLAEFIKELLTQKHPVLQQYIEEQIIWQLLIPTSVTRAWEFHIDFRSNPLRIRSGRHQRANYFVQVEADALLEAWSSKIGINDIIFLGHVQFFEKAFKLESGRCLPSLQNLELMDELPELLTWYFHGQKEST